MKPRFFILIGLFFLLIGIWLILGHVQHPGAEKIFEALPQVEPVIGHAVRFDKSPPLHALKPIFPASKIRRNNKVREIPIFRLPLEGVQIRPRSIDPVVQNRPVPRLLSTPLLSFEGISNVDNEAIFGFSVIPPDTNGDIGPNHYVQIVNILLEVFDRATGASLLGPLPISNLFSGFGGVCETLDSGDPIVLYDHLADRWLISQFNFDNTTNVLLPPYHQCIAISQTGDPTGAYFRYDFIIPNNKFNDYPKFGVWPDGYYMTVNQFLFGFSFAGAGIFAFDRTKMLAGDPTAGFIYFDLQTFDPTFFGMLPSDLDGPPPPAGTPNYFLVGVADELGISADAMRIFEFRADFVNPANSIFIERPESPIAVAPFDPDMCNFSTNRSCIPQPGTSIGLDALSERLMFRLPYRNFGTHESLIANHTVDVDGTDHAGVRYYEIRRNLPGGSFFVQEQATFAPDSDHRWMGSAAMDKDGNLAIGYSVSGPATFPSIRYAGRLATDPPNGLFQGEMELQTGGGSQTSFSSRWGDYSMLAIDPIDDCTFWYTNQYYPTTSGDSWQTRIGAFRFPSCTPALQGTLQGIVRDAASNAPIAGIRILANDGTNLFETATNPAGNYSRILSPGTYTLTISAISHESSTPVVVTITNGTTTIQDFTLNPLPTPTPLRSWGIFGDIPVPKDYDGDRKADIAVWRPGDGNWYILSSAGGLLISPWGLPADIPVPGDYNGDQKADFAVFRPNTWFILNSVGGFQVLEFGTPGVTDSPVPGDYDGDGITDLAMFEPSVSIRSRIAPIKWNILSSRSGDLTRIQWGLSGDIPTPADYDGDGKTDVAVWRPSEGNWYIILSGGGLFIAGWGLRGDVPVPGDYDGDGKTDVAVWRPGEGNWYTLRSTAGLLIRQWGLRGDVPVPADYDGDGTTDLAVWRPNTGEWFITFDK